MSAKFLLVHGAWAGGWVWDSIVPKLRAEGAQVIAPDLPGQFDSTPASAVDMSLYLDDLAQLMAQHNDDGQPFTLVGHSGGGMVISQLAERLPLQVAKLVYVAGMMLPSGMTFPDLCDRVYGPGVGVGASLEVEIDADQQVASLRTENLHTIFFNCASPTQTQALINKFVPHPIGGWNLVNQLTEDRFGRVPRHYVRLLQDNSVPLQLQTEMLRLSPGASEHTLDTDHVPQVSCPEKLSELLLHIG